VLAPELEDAIEQSHLDESFLPVDLGPVLDGSFAQPQPTVLRRNDDRCLLYPASINGVHGESGAGKGWVVAHAIGQELRGRRTVIYVDLEDTAESIVARLRAMRLTPEQIAAGLVYVRPQAPFSTVAVDHLVSLVAEHAAALVVIDSLGEAFGLEGLNEDKDVEVGPWLRKVPRRIAEAGPAVLIVDHSTKSSDNPLYPSGSKRKRAAITGASYLAEPIKSFVKNEGGRLRITCAKDRHGNYRKGEVVAELVMAPSMTGAVDLELYEPDRRSIDESPRALVTALAAVAAAKAEGQPLSKSALRGLIKGRTDDRKAGIDLAVARGALAEQHGPRGSKLVTYVKDLPTEPAT
jgi:hypothetical protein